MAAVAAEPGAAVVPTTRPAATDGEGPPEPDSIGTGLPGALKDGSGAWESGPAVELGGVRVEDCGDGEERRHVRPELLDTDGLIQNLSGDRVSSDRFSPGLPADPEGGGNVSRSLRSDPQPPAVFLHSFPVPPPVTEAGLSLQEPAEPTTNGTTNRAETAAGRERGYKTTVQLELRPGPAESGMLSVPDSPNQEPEPCSEELPEPTPSCRSPNSSQTEPGPETGPCPPLLGSVQDLSPGSEVRVSLDHVIDDALVVSFRFGEKVFSGVLMDVSKRFGPYGIPITVFPRRDDKNRPQLSVPPSMPVANDDCSIKQEEVSPAATPPPHPWTSKPPPLFQEGAPYPPPLFIRDTYNQALPQPLPRKIKRPKRRYRCEEPTSIMNAIKLRPRQVLCDKCKSVVASGGQREARRGTVDLRSEEASRRRRQAEGPISLEVKRLRSDDKGGRAAPDRRSSSGLRLPSSAPVSSSSSSRRVLKGVASSSSGRMCLNSKKVLDKHSAVDRSKGRPVLNKLSPSHRRPKDQNQGQTQNQDQESAKAVTRAAALQGNSQKVHFTRRLQHVSGASGSSPLPPRMRLKPQSATLKSC
ncbi:LOW QUALITY PROTEIN: PWWP domain-containing protein 2A [Xyrichtys novacula]|uniref:LOW QUALITY PROTEIN: PWWP domain-containing protein 2A n=1 Tax=Xyrichtys novacula TaxID=13765 RepID=A0AAV1FQA4_XYRNO|nr:LOW QUALITY PROTEIN: PWWP domain-containing protein 2A [Xyrichtys novacula]